MPSWLSSPLFLWGTPQVCVRNSIARGSWRLGYGALGCRLQQDVYLAAGIYGSPCAIPGRSACKALFHSGRGRAETGSCKEACATARKAHHQLWRFYAQNQHGAKHAGFRQQNPQAEQQLYAPPSFQYPRQLYTTPGGFECWHWSCKAELWSEQLAAQPKPPVKVDVSKIKVGVKVKHKAFGVGTVTAIQPDMVTVRFGSVEKKFLLPAAIVQGYLMLI